MAALDQGLAPFGLLRTAIEFGQADQQQGVLGRVGAVFHQRRCAFVTRLARGQAQFQQPALGEQGQAGARLQQGAPVETGVGAEHLALVKALLTRSIAYGVGGFLAQQRIVATDHIDRGQSALQVLVELGGGELHRKQAGHRSAPHGLNCPEFPAAIAAAFPPAGCARPPVRRLRPWRVRQLRAATGPAEAASASAGARPWR
ncbi:hypothetical protein D3C79_867890 [compost metagenome]